MSKSFNSSFLAGYSLAVALQDLESKAPKDDMPAMCRELEVLRRVALMVSDTPKRMDKHVKHQCTLALLWSLNELLEEGVISDSLYDDLYMEFSKGLNFRKLKWEKLPFHFHDLS